MHSQRPPIPLAQYLEISTGLRGLYYSKRELLAGHRQVGCFVAGDLQEDSRIGTAFVCLSGGVQEARAKAEARGRLLAIAQRVAHCLQSFLISFVHLDVAKQRCVIPGSDRVEMGAQICCESFLLARSNGQLACVLLVGEELDALVFEDRRLGRKRSRLFVLLREFARLDLAGFHVGLIEAVDSDYRSGDCGCDLPAEELLADVVLVEHLNADDRESGFLQRVHFRVLRGIGDAFEADVNKQPVFTINVGRADLFAIDRDNAFALFAG